MAELLLDCILHPPEHWTHNQ